MFKKLSSKLILLRILPLNGDKDKTKPSEETKINLLVDSYDVLEILEKKLRSKINIYLKVNVGYNRAGVDYESDSINDIILFMLSLIDIVLIEIPLFSQMVQTPSAV